MGKYILRRVLEMILTLFLIATATFFLLEAVPGDPLAERADKMAPEIRANLYARYGLDKPMMERYFITMKGICVGDFGESFVYMGQTVQSMMQTRFPVSARLGLQQVTLGIGVGLLLGILAAMKRGTVWDYIVIAISVLLISVPHLIFGLLLQRFFAGSLQWFPAIGWPEGGELCFGGWKYTILPMLAGCFSYIALYARLLKTSMLDVVGQDYVLTAESKGLSRGRIIRKHILRNAFIPIVTRLPISIAMSVTGNFFVENIFSVPGIGQSYIMAVNSQDLSLIMGLTFLIAVLYIIAQFFTDLLYIAVDPRITLSGGGK